MKCSLESGFPCVSLGRCTARLYVCEAILSEMNREIDGATVRRR